MIEHGKLLLHPEFGSPEKAIIEVTEILQCDFEGKKLNFELKLD